MHENMAKTERCLFPANAMRYFMVALVFICLFGLMSCFYLGEAETAYAKQPSGKSHYIHKKHAKYLKILKSGKYKVIAKTSKGFLAMRKGGYYFIKKNGKRSRETWKTIKGNRYYFKKNGKAAKGSCNVSGVYYIFNSRCCLASRDKNTIVRIGNDRFYADPSGKAITGWTIKRGKVRFSYVSGKLASNETVGNVTFLSKGYADPNNAKAQLLIKANEIVKKICTDDMDRMTKLHACWNYVRQLRYVHALLPDFSDPDWMYKCAMKMYEYGGSCWGYSTAFAALAMAVGAEPYLVYRMPGNPPNGHAWVYIDGGYWDTLLSEGNAPTGKDPTSLATVAKF